jgi:heme exporter protein C
LLYVAILVLQQAYPNQAAGDKLIAILSLVGLLDLPIIHYSVYWWNTLHQGSSLMAFSKPTIHSSMLYPLLIMITGFMFYAAFIISLKARNLLLARERRAKWVQVLIQEK